MISHSGVNGQSASEETEVSRLSMISIDIEKACTEWDCCRNRTNVRQNHAGIKKRYGRDWTILSNTLNGCIRGRTYMILSKSETHRVFC
jgi:hypothetical protein